MKKLTILMLCALTIFSACKKKTEEPVDARDQYLGTWEGTMTTTVFSACKKKTEEPANARDQYLGTWEGTTPIVPAIDADTDKEVITKTANTTNKITLTDASNAKDFMTATVNGNSILFDQKTRAVHGKGYTATITLNGTGAISGKDLSAAGTLKYSINGFTFDGSWSASWAKVAN